MSRARGWCFTVNNYTDEDVENMENIVCRAICVAKEVGESKTPHLQGVVYFEHPKTLRAAKRKISPRAHLEIMRGTWQQASDYCRKDSDIVRDYGEGPAQGRRNDINEFSKAIEERESKESIVKGEFATQFAKYPRFYNACVEVFAKSRTKEFRTVEVEVYWGPTGTGKTRKAMEHEDVFLWDPCSPEWWCGYEGEKILVIDEFGRGSLPIKRLLRLLDGYQCKLPIKGGCTYAEWTKVIITSNTNPDEWYTGANVEHVEAFKRRVTRIIYMN